jgi:hypothetical protein
MSKETIMNRHTTTIPQRLARIMGLLGLMCFLGLMLAPLASAQSGPPQWTITPVSQPTNLAPGSTYSSEGDEYKLTVMNTGDGATDGSPITVTDTLPAGITPDATVATGFDYTRFINPVSCSASGQTVTCTDPDYGPLALSQAIVIMIPVDVAPDAASSVINQVTVDGGGAATATASEPTTISASPPPFAPLDLSVASSSDQAGAHPDLTTAMAFPTDSSGNPTGDVKDITVDLPAGFSGQVAGVPSCPMSVWRSGTASNCPDDTAVGMVTLTFGPRGADIGGAIGTMILPVYNLQPDPGETAKLGIVNQVGSQALITVRPGDFGLRATLINVGPSLGITSTFLTLWGVPGDPTHDSLRGKCESGYGFSTGDCPSGAASVPFITNPTSCSGSQLQAVASVDSWEDPTTQLSTSSNMGPFTGCDALQFQPSLTARPVQSTPDTPSGFEIDLSVPQNDNPDQLASAELQNATVTLPQGVVMSPSAADGLKDCTDAQVGLGNSDAPACPDGSKIGTTTVTTPALPDQLTGDIYLAGPDSGPITSPPYHIFLTMAGDGVLIKLRGTVTPDLSTGQLTTTFTDNPQLPFSDLKLDFKDGPRAPLATPSTCGTFTTTSDLQPWSSPDSGPDPTPSDSFQISGCGNPNTFAPTFTAGATNAQAGAYSPFTLTFSRTDADQGFSNLTTTLPPGLVAKLAGVPLCSDSDANAGNCPAGSQVGTVEAASGPGSHPFWLPGKAYLTGPYKGGPYGLAVEIPAIAGPFDLGVVVVRNAIHINPTTAQVSVTSDKFPTIIGGIPIQLRSVNVDLNRPDFMVNPTSCNPMSITGTLGSLGGMSSNIGNRFQVGGCASLGFSPKLTMKLTGKGRTKSGDHPNLVSVLIQRGGQANIHNVRVALPLSMALDPNNSQHVCSYAVAQAVSTGPANCPASTLVGHATAITPLLSQPLSGPVYLVQGIRYQNGVPIHTLPSLLIPLRGQIALDLRAQTSVSHGKLVTTFPIVPDAAVSKFTLKINGGKKGILVITGRGRSICGSPQVSEANLVGQNGKAQYPNVKMGTPCRASHHKEDSRRHGRHT